MRNTLVALKEKKMKHFHFREINFIKAFLSFNLEMPRIKK